MRWSAEKKPTEIVLHAASGTFLSPARIRFSFR
jgi:membrane protease YdiL (CAAX protease family)